MHLQFKDSLPLLRFIWDSLGSFLSCLRLNSLSELQQGQSLRISMDSQECMWELTKVSWLLETNLFPEFTCCHLVKLKSKIFNLVSFPFNHNHKSNYKEALKTLWKWEYLNLICRWWKQSQERIRTIYSHWRMAFRSWVNIDTNLTHISNNSIEINTIECVEKENFAFDKLDQCHVSESETAAGRIGAHLQEKTVKLLQRRRWISVCDGLHALI